ncbi:MAG: OmpA family protein [Betaproteobacteria bacterium]|nr:OmpA family protein [Betaproteobacteria bacterium]
MHTKLRLLTILCLAVLASACGKDDTNNAGTAVEPTPASAPAPVPMPTPALQAAPESTPAPQQVTPEPAAEPVPTAAAFDVNAFPISDKDIGEFPFFTPPEGHKYVTFARKEILESKSLKKFARYYYPIDKETLYPVEGKTLKAVFYDVERKAADTIDTLLIQHNYENAITAAGGTKIFDGNVVENKTYRKLSSQDRELYGPQFSHGVRQVYLIRKQDMEIWFEINCTNSSRCSYVVTQKGEMKQSVSIVPVSEMKLALDKIGHIALYINFDVDKATIRPDSQGTINEIVKLLETYPDLKIRVEGHTDDTGGAEHNATLSENRASSVFGALLARGIPQNRLEAKGFGMTRPIADNGTEEGRAKNRRVELVKISG